MTRLSPASARKRIARIGQQLVGDLLLAAAYAAQARGAASRHLQASIETRAELARHIAARYIGGAA